MVTNNNTKSITLEHRLQEVRFFDFIALLHKYLR